MDVDKSMKIEEDEDIITKLFSADLDHILMEIFLNLDPGSLKEARSDN